VKFFSHGLIFEKIMQSREYGAILRYGAILGGGAKNNAT
jgi:hypothetical protein